MRRTSIKNRLILSFLALLLIVTVVVGIVNHMAEDIYISLAISTALALAAGIIFGGLLSRSILSRLRSLAGAAKEISQGDLTKDIPLRSSDEIRDLEEVFTVMVSELRRMLFEMRNVFRQIQSTSIDLQDHVKEVVATSGEIDDAARAIAKVSEEQTLIVQKTSLVLENGLMNMGEMVRQSAETVGKVNEARLKTEAGEARAVETLTHLDGVLQEMADYTQPISRLANKVEKIKMVIGVMNNIAQKTDLLSLNAAIEATRAGESGKGFALVADEIRSMAEGSKRSSDEIRNMVEDILEDNRAVVDAISRSGQKMRRGREWIHEIAGTFGGMLSGVKEISREIKGIAEVTSRQIAEMKGILTHFQALSRLASESFVATQKTTLATKDQKEDMVKMLQVVKDLNDLSQNMMKTQQRFRLGEKGGVMNDEGGGTKGQREGSLSVSVSGSQSQSSLFDGK